MSELEVKANEILKEKQIVRPLYTKESIALIDNNIKHFSLPVNISSDLAINNALL
jgi:hypothetical protein